MAFRVLQKLRHSTEELCLNGYKFIAQGVGEGTSKSGVGMFLSKTAQKAFIGYNPVSDRIILARFKGDMQRFFTKLMKN